MIFFKIFIKFILIFLLILGSYSFSSELIIPPKKPTLSEEVKKKIISNKNIIPPIKPTVKKEKEIQEEKKEKVEKAETDKDFQNIGILLPKKKPTIIVKKTEPKKEKVKKSKYYSKKDVKIAQQSLDLIKKKVFSMNEVWNILIKNDKLFGLESSQKFYHLNTEEMYKKISNLGIID